MRETTWISESKERIEDIANYLFETEKSDYVEFSIPRIMKTNIRVYAKSKLYLQYLSLNFPKPNTSKETPWITLYYDCKSTDSIKSFMSDLPEIETPCIGLFNESSNTGLITGLDEYGLLTSTVIGMHSRVLFASGWNPIHGAAIHINDQGVVLIGYHGAGKSTALLNLIKHSRGKVETKVLTDDWSVVRQKGSEIKVHSIESKMSFSEKLVQENPELNLMKLYKKHAVNGIGKLWIDINKVLGKGTYIQETDLKKILVFSTNPNDKLITKVPLEIVVELLVDSSYHMPDCGQGFKKHQIDFWNEKLNNLEYVQINSRFSLMSKNEIYGTIIDNLLK